MTSIDAELIELFSTKHIPQIRDELKYVNHELNKIDINLNSNLNLHYKDILNITSNVTDLFNSLQAIDADFRDLCFNDEIFQLQSLPEFNINSNNSSNSTNSGNIENLNNHENSSSKELNSVYSLKKKNSTNSNLLILSQLSLQLQRLINFNFDIDDDMTNNNYTKNNSFVKIWNELLIKLNELPHDCFIACNDNFHKIVKDNCQKLQNFIIDNNENLPFSELQWIQFYNILNLGKKTNETNILKVDEKKSTIDKFPWDAKLTERLVELIFNNLYNILIFDEDNMIILNFKKMNKDFEKFIFAKINTNFENDMNELTNKLEQNNIINDTETSDNDASATTTDSKTDTVNSSSILAYTLDSTYLTTDKLDVEYLINQANLQSNGLINESRIVIDKLIRKLINNLEDWIKFRGDLKVFQELKDNLIGKLESLHSEISQLSNPNNVVESFSFNYYNDIFITAVNDQLQRVRDLQIE